MSLFSLILSFQFCIYIFLGIYVFSRNRKSSVHLLFFLLCMALAYWQFPSIFLYSTVNINTALACIMLASPGLIMSVPLSLHFCIELTGRIKFRRIWYLVYVPAVIYSIRGFFQPLFFSKIYLYNDVWRFTPDFWSLWHITYSVYGVASVLFCVFMLIRWFVTTDSRRQKKQAGIVSMTLLASLVLITLEEVLIPLTFSGTTLGLGPHMYIVWHLGIAFAIVKYRMLDIDTSLVTDNVFAHIDESIILLDRDMNIVNANRKTEDLLNIDLSSLKGRPFTDCIEPAGSFAAEIQGVIDGTCKTMFMKLNLKGMVKNILVDAEISPIVDPLGDIVGALIIARETRTEEFIENYRITKREMQVVLEILSGHSIKDISERLSISEITVKTHITSIYNKLGIDNRIKLLSILRCYCLTP